MSSTSHLSNCAKRLLRPGPRKLEMSVRPSVRTRFSRFLRTAYEPGTASDPLRKMSTLVSLVKTWKAWHVCYLLCRYFDDHFFDQKQYFYQKKYHRLLGVKTYENHRNRCSLTVCFWVDLIKKYSFPVDAHVTQRMTRWILFAQYQNNYILQSFAPPALRDAV